MTKGPLLHGLPFSISLQQHNCSWIQKPNQILTNIMTTTETLGKRMQIKRKKWQIMEERGEENKKQNKGERTTSLPVRRRTKRRLLQGEKQWSHCCPRTHGLSLRLISSPKPLSKRSFLRPWGRASAAGKSVRKWHDKACGGARKEGRKERKKEKGMWENGEKASYPNVPRNGDGVVFPSLHSLTANATVSVHIMPSWWKTGKRTSPLSLSLSLSLSHHCSQKWRSSRRIFLNDLFLGL